MLFNLLFIARLLIQQTLNTYSHKI